MGFTFRPAQSISERAAVFVALIGGTNAGKTFSALRLARGMAGPTGKIAVVDTEGGRTLHLKEYFDFDAHIMAPPFHPKRFAEAAEAAENGGYDVLLIDSFSQQWSGVGGVLEMAATELDRMAGDDFKKRERVKMASWIKPKGAHKLMVMSLLQRRIPIIFSIRGQETVKPGAPGEKPETIFKAICNADFPYELTVSFRLAANRKGFIDLSDPKSWKMERPHQAIFRDGEQLSEEHGAKLAAWARGETAERKDEPPATQPTDWAAFGKDLVARAEAAADMDAYERLIHGSKAMLDAMASEKPQSHANLLSALTRRKTAIMAEAA